MRGIVRALLAMLALLPGTAQAQQQNPTLTEAERGIRRHGASEEQEAQLRIERLAVDARLVGRVAQVTVEMLIASDADQPYEGKLALRLPPGAVVNGYALDVDGAMIPGQLLEAPKARNLYEDQVRAGIDPGLGEVGAGGSTTRIFPITRAQPRRVRVSFAAPFDLARGLVLPLDRDRPVKELSVTIAASGYAEAPAATFGGRAVELRQAQGCWTAQLTLADQRLSDGLVVNGGRPATLAIGRHASGERFFVLDDGATAVPAPQARTGRLRIYWDRSLSHRGASPELEEAVLAQLAADSEVRTIDLITFASDRPRVVTLAGAAALRAALRRVTYRGGSSLAGLDNLPLTPADRCVMVFDGQVTIDRGAQFRPNCRLDVLTAATGADEARLGRIARASGGTVVRVAPRGVSDAADALRSARVTLVAVLDGTGRRLAFRALPTAAGRWLLVGPMPASGGVRVRLSDGSERRYADAAVVPSDAPGALWAAEQVAALADDPAQHDAMAAAARRYQVAGPGMSFLVLERPEQYLEAQLSPPPGFSAAWMGEYRRALEEAERTRTDARRERLDYVVEQWSERRTWWQRRFVPGRRRGNGGEAIAPPPVVAPAPVPAPPPVEAPPAPEADIAVTAERRAEPPAAVAAPAPADAGNDMVVAATRVTARPAAERPRQAAVALDLADLSARRPYITALAAATPAARPAVLAAQEAEYGSVPAFYLDTAEWFRGKGDAATADLLLLSALELPTSDDETRQIVAFRLERDRHYDRAVELAEHLAAANAQFRPQPGRDLALALAARGKVAGRAGRADLERAFRLLVDTALNPASSDFDGIEVIALMEANALIPLIEAAGGRVTLDPRLRGRLDTDVRVVIEWTADDADIDLWVDEPGGERVMYSNQLSDAGGQISNDMTDGYGPEEYAIRRAPAGPYRVRINGYDADRINPNGPGHVLIRLQRNFARVAAREELVDADLSFQTGSDRNRDERTRPVATLTVGGR